MAAISNNDIARAIYMVIKDKNSADQPPVVKKIVHFLARRHLLGRTTPILLQLRKIIDTEENRTIVKVSSAGKLGERTVTHLAEILKKRYSTNKIALVESIDKGLLGGIRLEVNDEVIDLSIKRKITKLQEYLTINHE